jgi:hypothetical protein
LEPTRALPDVRLERRLSFMIDQFSSQPNATIPQATEERKHMDAAYAFFGHTRIRPDNILHACLPPTRLRIQNHARILVIQDTSEANFSTLNDTDELGYTNGSHVQGLLIHSSLAVTTDGLPLGLLTQQIWTRDPAHKGDTKTRRQRPTADKESFRWMDHAAAARSVLGPDVSIVHIADREGDIYDWLAAPRSTQSHLLIRIAQANRTVVYGPDGESGKLAAVVGSQTPLGYHTLEIPRADDRPSRQVVLTLRVAAVRIAPPRHAKNRKSLPEVPVWVIEAVEENPPRGQKGLCWRLVSTESVTTLDEAVRALKEYTFRWRIERFHYVLKQGCQVERLQLGTADRLSNAIAVYSQVAVRVLRLAYMARVSPDTPATEEFDAVELAVLSRGSSKKSGGRVRTIREAVCAIARLGGHLGRKNDHLPGTKVLWRGLQRLHDRTIGFQMIQLASCQDTRNG